MSGRPDWDNQFREDDDERHARWDRQRGRTAYRAGKPFNAKASVDWQRGWQDAKQDRKLDETP